MNDLKIVAICGSLSSTSLNKKALVAWIGHLPAGVQAKIEPLDDLPLYNPDLEPEPEPVAALKVAIGQTDAVMIATPEYNYGVPGVLKNALDWASRPAYKSVFAHTPVAMFGASPGPVGTARAQGQLKQILLGMVADIYPCPELTIGMAKTKLDESGNVSDPTTDAALRRHATEFVAWVQRRNARR